MQNTAPWKILQNWMRILCKFLQTPPNGTKSIGHSKD